MKAIVVRAHGGIEQLVFEERAVPEPGPREVRVRMKAIGLNSLDRWVRRGVPGHVFPLPIVPSSDGAGVVDAIGAGVTTVAVGDAVVIVPAIACGLCEPCTLGNDQLCVRFQILGESRDGTAQEQVVVPERGVMRKPARLSFEEAAAIPLVFQTAWAMLVRKARIRAGDAVLVHAAGSGVGSAAIQICKLFGCSVITTAGTAEKCAKAKALGADHAIDHTKRPFADEVRLITGKRGVDVVFEHVGAVTFADSIKCLTRGGRLVTCGATTGADVQINLRQVFFKNLQILGNTMGTREDLARVWRLVEQGRLKAVVDRVMPWERVREAHEVLEARGIFGKVVLAVG